MAYVGFRTIKVASRTGAKTYGESAACGKPISVSVSPNYAEGSLYGGDVVAESDREFTNATVTLGTTYLPTAMANIMFGHTVAEEQIDYNAFDEVHYVGVGMTAPKKIDGVKKYEGTFLYKAKFNEPEKAYETKGDSITYNTPSFEGAAEAEDDGDWQRVKTFDTQAAAEAWVDSMFAGTADSSGTSGNGGT